MNNPAPKPTAEQKQQLTVAPQKQEKKEVTGFLESPAVREAVAKVLPKHLTPERLTRVAITAVMTKPELVEAANHPIGKASLLNALMRCSQAGLEPDGRLAHLIPFWSSDHRCYLVQVIFDYKGLVLLAKRNGIDAKAILVRSEDEFEYIEDDGTGKTIVRHKFSPFKDRGDIIGVYSRAIEAGKNPDYEFMSIEEVEDVRSRSRAKDKGPWVTDYGEMAKKTPLRRHSKRWELQPEIRDILNADDDTPEPLNETKMVRPIFNKAETKEITAEASEENGAAVETPLPSNDDGDLGPQQPEDKPAEKPNLTLAVRNLLKIAKINEGVLLDYLSQTGETDGSFGSLEELAAKKTVLLQAVNDKWKDLLPKIKEVVKGAS